MVPEILRQASVVLIQEVGKIPRTILDGIAPAVAERSGLVSATHSLNPAPAIGGKCPVTGAAVPSASPGPGGLQQQAHELLQGVLSLNNLGRQGSGLGGPGLPGSRLAGKNCPVTHASAPTFPVERDELRRRAHEFIETLLITFNEATGEKGLPAENQVPLLDCAAPVQPGGAAKAAVQIANEEGSTTEVTLYSTNFVADQGYEIPSLRVTILPRVISIPAGGKAEFEITIAVPQQTPKGYYSGLIQAMGSKYFKAVLSLEVL
jgi:hypothetical protein